VRRKDSNYSKEEIKKKRNFVNKTKTYPAQKTTRTTKKGTIF
jgi:hypothetical protein